MGIKRNTTLLNTSRPDIASQWHPSKNNGVTPDHVSIGSHSRFWWKCPKGPDHEWETRHNQRTSGRGCPYCTGVKVSITNSLASQYQQVAAEWHPTKNGNKWAPVGKISIWFYIRVL